MNDYNELINFSKGSKSLFPKEEDVYKYHNILMLWWERAENYVLRFQGQNRILSLNESYTIS